MRLKTVKPGPGTIKANGVVGRSLFIDGIEVFRITLDDNGMPRIALGVTMGTAIKYLDLYSRNGKSRNVA